MEIVEITSAETLIIRHQVLWPEKPREFCIVEDDDSASHFGVRLDGKIVSVASVYFDYLGNKKSTSVETARLRKFATKIDYQGQGIGSALFEHILQELKNMGTHTLWFDARETAISFYARYGFQARGQRFYKGEVPYFKMSKIL